jgi:hypothetical protein
MIVRYVHSYQSFLWNHAASHRAKVHGMFNFLHISKLVGCLIKAFNVAKVCLQACHFCCDELIITLTDKSFRLACRGWQGCCRRPRLWQGCAGYCWRTRFAKSQGRWFLRKSCWGGTWWCGRCWCSRWSSQQNQGASTKFHFFMLLLLLIVNFATRNSTAVFSLSVLDCRRCRIREVQYFGCAASFTRVRATLSSTSYTIWYCTTVFKFTLLLRWYSQF